MDGKETEGASKLENGAATIKPKAATPAPMKPCSETTDKKNFV
jgi:hypothetical protein